MSEGKRGGIGIELPIMYDREAAGLWCVSCRMNTRISESLKAVGEVGKKIEYNEV